MGVGSRKLGERAESQAYFIQAMNSLADGYLVPVPGGVLIRDDQGHVLGALGITGDTSDQDEDLAIRAIQAHGFTPDP